MSAPHLIVLLIVGLATLYVGRNLFDTARNLFSKKSEGCGGCGKCAFAEKPGPKTPVVSARSNVIPLGDIRTMSKK